MEHVAIWKFLAGLGFFLFGMSQLEHVLKSGSGRPLKLFLKRNTQNIFKSITGGAIITGILQSSSVVSLIVLAFVQSGIITFRNALGVILGSNLGTTLTSWIFATVGFKFNVQDYSLPIIAIAAIFMFFFEKRRKLYNLFVIFFSMGILFLGLGFMKEGAMAFVADVDLNYFTRYGTIIFVLVGFVLTTIIQSSSATVAITLTAIYTGVLPLPSAAAVVIGSEVGTTIKILFWGMKGSADKKRVAWGNFIYNIFTAVIAYLALSQLLYVIEHFLHISDPLIALVAFQTTINIVSIIIFVPFLNVFANWLGTRFSSAGSDGNSYMGKNLPAIAMLATDALRSEALNLLRKTILFNDSILHLRKTEQGGLFENIKSFTRSDTDITGEYNRLKQTEGDLLGYYADIQENNVGKDDATQMLQYVNAVRQSVFAAKAIKDIAHNLRDLDASGNDVKYRQGEIVRNEWATFHNNFDQIMNTSANRQLQTEIDNLLEDVRTQEEVQRSEVIMHLKNNQLNEVEASTLMNVHRELLSCQKSLLTALSNIGTDASAEAKPAA